MSKEGVKKLIDRALKDQGFAGLLKENPEQAVEEYDLTPEEVSAIRAMNPEKAEQFAAFLDRRMVKTDSDDKTDDDPDDLWVLSVTD